MTFTSFSSIQMQQPASVSQTQPAVLKQGQVFHGAIKQLYPDQLAEVQMGGQRLVAKLEVPLKAGDTHYFQVTATQPELQLKVVSGPVNSSSTISQQVNQLLDSMQLPKTAEMQTLVAHFLKEQLPLSKDQLIAMEQWMKQLPAKVATRDVLSALQKMVELKMPMQQEVFQAFINGQMKDGFIKSLQTLTEQISQNMSLPVNVKENLLQQLLSLSRPFESGTGGVMLGKMIQSLLSNDSTVQKKEAILSLLKQAQIVPKQATLENWLSVQVTSSTNPGKGSISLAGQVIQQVFTTQPTDTPKVIQQFKEWVQSQPLLTQEQKGTLLQSILKVAENSSPTLALKNAGPELQESLLKMFSEIAQTKPFHHDSLGLSARQHVLSLLNGEMNPSLDTPFQTLVRHSDQSTLPMQKELLLLAENHMQANLEGKAFLHAVKHVLRHLGVSYEANLLSSKENLHEIAQQLKPQLVALLQDPSVTGQMKDAAETVVSRMNGMQLLSSENGPQHQLIMQIPIEVFGRKTDATLQWNGRMKDDGKIDADYARVLFYLQLHALKDTVIDMQVQNRIISLNIYNEHLEIQSIAPSIQQSLKEGLASIQYQLSGVFVKPFEKSAASTVKTPAHAKKEKPVGVDIRV